MSGGNGGHKSRRWSRLGSGDWQVGQDGGCQRQTLPQAHPEELPGSREGQVVHDERRRGARDGPRRTEGGRRREGRVNIGRRLRVRAAQGSMQAKVAGHQRERLPSIDAGLPGELISVVLYRVLFLDGGCGAADVAYRQGN